jgi:hypothetical protein
MDERRTLSILGWLMGSLVGTLFLLNAIAMSRLAPPAQPSADYAVTPGTISASLN